MAKSLNIKVKCRIGTLSDKRKIAIGKSSKLGLWCIKFTNSDKTETDLFLTDEAKDKLWQLLEATHENKISVTKYVVTWNPLEKEKNGQWSIKKPDSE